jgi:hypothetical protein
MAKARRVASGGSDVKAMELIQRSGILNKSATLDQIMGLSMTLAGPGFGGGAAASWTFISPHYIYKGDQKVAKGSRLS